jgi:hypothetical protein
MQAFDDKFVLEREFFTINIKFLDSIAPVIDDKLFGSDGVNTLIIDLFSTSLDLVEERKGLTKANPALKVGQLTSTIIYKGEWTK